MEANVRKEVIPELDQLTTRASELKKELDYLLGRHNLYKVEGLASALNAAGKLESTLRSASDALKRNGGARGTEDDCTVPAREQAGTNDDHRPRVQSHVCGIAL